MACGSDAHWPWLASLKILSATTCDAGLDYRTTPRLGLRRILDAEDVPSSPSKPRCQASPSCFGPRSGGSDRPSSGAVVTGYQARSSMRRSWVERTSRALGTSFAVLLSGCLRRSVFGRNRGPLRLTTEPRAEKQAAHVAEPDLLDHVPRTAHFPPGPKSEDVPSPPSPPRPLPVGGAPSDTSPRPRRSGRCRNRRGRPCPEESRIPAQPPEDTAFLFVDQPPIVHEHAVGDLRVEVMALLDLLEGIGNEVLAVLPPEAGLNTRRSAS